jgi:hypothetical protein
VLYEMLAGRPVFAGRSVSEVAAALLRDEPDWSALRPDVPRGVTRLIGVACAAIRAPACSTSATHGSNSPIWSTTRVARHARGPAAPSPLAQWLGVAALVMAALAAGLLSARRRRAPPVPAAD